MLYQEYSELKKGHGAEVAREIMRFRLSHLGELLAVASEENLLEDSQCRETRSYDVYQDDSLYCNAKQLLDVFKRDLPVEGQEIEIVENKAALQVGDFFVVFSCYLILYRICSWPGRWLAALQPVVERCTRTGS